LKERLLLLAAVDNRAGIRFFDKAFRCKSNVTPRRSFAKKSDDLTERYILPLMAF
jgi:hypothetical protein